MHPGNALQFYARTTPNIGVGSKVIATVASVNGQAVNTTVETAGNNDLSEASAYYFFRGWRQGRAWTARGRQGRRHLPSAPAYISTVFRRPVSHGEADTKAAIARLSDCERQVLHLDRPGPEEGGDRRAARPQRQYGRRAPDQHEEKLGLKSSAETGKAYTYACRLDC
jgi:hypothetical protein